MHAQKYPFAVRLIGFGPAEGEQLCTALAQAPAAGPSYFCLLDDSLQEPDLCIANGDSLKALTMLVACAPSAIQPALIVGNAPVDLAWPQLARPLQVPAMFAVLAELMRKRADALALITARGLPFVPERRRRSRLDVDLTDPAEYARRRQAPPHGAILIVDKGGALRDHVARLLGARKLSIEWTDSAGTAIRLCEETPVSVVMINTSTAGIDPYQLCASIKALDGAARIAVLLLVSPAFHYDTARARAAGVRGLLDKPVADRHLLAALQKLLSLPK